MCSAQATTDSTPTPPPPVPDRQGLAVLLVEDTPPLARVYQEYLSDEPYRMWLAETGRAALARLKEAPPAAVILDLKLPDMDGLDILRHIRQQRLPAAVVVITAHGSVSNAVSAMQAGADDFIVKPFTAERLIYTLRNALERRHLSEQVDELKANIQRRAYGGFIGSSLAMQAVYTIIDNAAASRASVFITGDSGTGKEVCAEAIHARSGRTGRLVALNCAAIPHELLESEVFGHVKGSFTGAVADREGAAALANGGTLFLDEICEMDLSLQAKLLRFIQTGSFQKVGSGAAQRVDVRFVAATNRDPWTEVEAGRFREDLYYRLNVIPLHLPPLKDRDGDVVEIARDLLARFAEEEGKTFTALSAEAEALLLGYPWPGNVRQLQNAIRNAVVLNNGPLLEAGMLAAALERMGGPLAGGEGAPAAPSPSSGANGTPPLPPVAGSEADIQPMWRVELAHIRRALALCGNNVPRAAARLEMSPSTIYRRLRDMAPDDSP
ncbi:sigma-54-dependent transcriptional regulator [Roseospirillum parvum]|uniref:DNA-binding transcriptional response regulator, NtrC family, contains REC, AAA-type ATPase, and a Fis-type DNA-binding domains n=1 Tax=Roseospirillum parvum TaxID=83401 RepID=A0A1G8G498_9PROT|nr:sigma-54 dependent transcriptional regulator [Roseospirillum parvum]SDH89185.1 DNA-binding transcriptional response regulator, NtrC family, contains REC, AAA-type ATPase, and a Fis-type DNA-binding domains [Roseospirillum parvum]